MGVCYVDSSGAGFQADNDLKLSLVINLVLPGGEQGGGCLCELMSCFQANGVGRDCLVSASSQLSSAQNNPSKEAYFGVAHPGLCLTRLSKDPWKNGLFTNTDHQLCSGLTDEQNGLTLIFISLQICLLFYLELL